MLKLLKYITLILFILNIPSIILVSISSSLSSLLSYFSFLLLVIYFVFNPYQKPNLLLIILGIFYFCIAGLNIFQGTEKEFIISFLKYMIVVIGGVKLMQNTTKTELYTLLIIGCLSIILHASFFSDSYGRYSGFYINPNAAGYICLSTFALSFGIKNKKLKYLGQIIAVLGGLLTFSRTFLIILTILNLISLKISFKNIKVFIAGFAIIIGIFSFGEIFNFSNPRYLAFKSIIFNDETLARKSSYDVGNDSRTETWSHFYGYILDKPIFGNGYRSFQYKGLWDLGPHNSFLLIIGEAGIIPLILFLFLFTQLIYRGFNKLSEKPHVALIGVSTFLFLLTSHNFFFDYHIILILIFVLNQIKLNEKNNCIN